MSKIYRVKTPFVGVFSKAPGLLESVVLEAGGVITIDGYVPVLTSGLVDVRYGDKTLSVYMRDVRDRTEIVEAQEE